MSRLLEVAAAVLDVSPSLLSYETKRGSIEPWDSLGHLCLVAAIEEKFGIYIPMEEVNSIMCLKDFTKYIKEEKSV